MDDELYGDQTPISAWPTREQLEQHRRERGPSEREIMIARQAAIGEEDQSIPGCDQLP